MAATKKKDDSVKEPAKKKERKVSTPEERIAKLEADLAAARQRAEVKANKAHDLLRTQRAKLIERRDVLQEKIDTITDELGDGDAGDNSFDDEQPQLPIED